LLTFPDVSSDGAQVTKVMYIYFAPPIDSVWSVSQFLGGKASVTLTTKSLAWSGKVIWVMEWVFVYISWCAFRRCTKL